MSRSSLTLALALLLATAGGARAGDNGQAQTATATAAPRDDHAAAATATAAPEGEPDPVLEELARVVGLRPDQRLAVKKIISDAETEYQAAIEKLHENDPAAAEKMEKLSEDIAKRARERISQVMDEKQRVLFAKYLREQEDLQRRDEGEDEARPRGDRPAPSTASATPAAPKPAK